MRELKAAALAVTLLLCVAGSGSAATAADFYIELLQKGIAQYNTAEYAQAAGLLRTAAFGLLEATDRYQTAQVYRTIVADKLEDAATAREAARRVLAAERVQRTYASLALPAPVRTTFENVAKKHLGATELAQLKNNSQSVPAPVVTPVQQQPPQTTTTTTTTTNTTTTKPAEKPAEKKPEPKVTEKKPEAKPPAKPAPVPPTPQPPKDPAPLFTSAEKALANANLNEARRIYRQLLDITLTHEQALRLAEGLYRARDFSNVIRAFDRAGALKRGEEPYRFYLAVALFEAGRYAAAKKELDATLPFIEVTPDVAAYRDKISGANNP